MSLTVVVVVGATGCGGPSTALPASPTAGGPGSLPAATGVGASVGSSVDGSARLTAAFRTMASGYEFDATVTIAGQTATHAAGRWLGGRSEFVIESGGTALTYRSIPPRSWAYQEGTGWVELADKAPSGDPLEPFRHPTMVTVTSEGADALVLQATYTPKTLGLAGSTPVVVQISIATDGRTTATYTVPSASGPATTVTILTAGKGAPITVPPPAG